MDKIFFKNCEGMDVSIQVRADGSAVVRAGSGKCSHRKRYKSFNGAMRAIGYMLEKRSCPLLETL